MSFTNGIHPSPHVSRYSPNNTLYMTEYKEPNLGYLSVLFERNKKNYMNQWSDIWELSGQHTCMRDCFFCCFQMHCWCNICHSLIYGSSRKECMALARSKKGQFHAETLEASTNSTFGVFFFKEILGLSFSNFWAFGPLQLQTPTWTSLSQLNSHQLTADYELRYWKNKYNQTSQDQGTEKKRVCYRNGIGALAEQISDRPINGFKNQNKKAGPFARIPRERAGPIVLSGITVWCSLNLLRNCPLAAVLILLGVTMQEASLFRMHKFQRTHWIHIWLWYFHSSAHSQNRT